MPNFNYDVHVDTLRNGAFAGSIDSLDDLVSALSWQQGMDEPRGQLAQPGSAQIVLNNVNLSSPCAPFDHEYESAEKLTNGDFSTWTTGTPNGWTLVGVSSPTRVVTQVGVNETYGGTGTGALNLYRSGTSVAVLRVRQTLVLTMGKTYLARLVISAVGASNVGGIQMMSTTGASPLYQTVGTKEWVFVADSNRIEIIAPGGTSVDMTVDSISVVEVCKYRAVAEGMLVRISSTDAYGVGTPLARTQFWVGRIARVGRSYAPQTGRIEDQSIILECEDPLAELFQGEYLPALMQNTTVGAVIGAVLDSGEALYPYRRAGWLMGVEGASALGLTARLAPTEGYRALDTGETAIEWCGDATDRGEGVSIASYLQDVIASEAGGRLFWDGRTSMVTFHSRNHDLTTTPLTTVTSERYSAAELRYGDPVYNTVTIYYTERQLGVAASVVWSADNLPLQLAAGASRDISARYRLTDDDTATIAVVDGLAPLAVTDFAATDEADGGTDMTGYVAVRVEWKANSAKLHITNTSGVPIYIQTLQLRGTALIARQGQLTKDDGDSIYQYGLRPAGPINLVNIANSEFAESVASYLLGIYSQPRQFVRQVTFEANRDTSTAEWLFSCGIGTRITLQDSSLNHDQDYIIVGERHSVEAASKVHYATWVLKPMSREQYFILDQSRLGVDTRLAL